MFFQLFHGVQIAFVISFKRADIVPVSAYFKSCQIVDKPRKKIAPEVVKPVGNKLQNVTFKCVNPRVNISFCRNLRFFDKVFHNAVSDFHKPESARVGHPFHKERAQKIFPDVRLVQRVVIDLGIRVAGRNEKIVGKILFRLLYAARGSKRFFFIEIRQPYAETPPV